MVMPAILGRALVATLTNNEGADVMKRRLVVLDAAADAAFALTTTSGDRSVLGVTLESVVLGATGRVQVQGVTSCLVEGAVTRGHYLRASATPGALEDAGVLVDAAGDPPDGSCAIALESGADGDEIAVHFTGMMGGGSGGGGGPATQLDADAEILDVNAIADGQFLKRVGLTVVGSPPGPAIQMDADGEILSVDAIADGQYLKRVGTTVVGAAPGPASQLDADGETLNVNAVTDGEFLKRVGLTIVSAAAGGAGAATQLNADGTVLDVNVVVDGEYLRRVGATIVSGTPAGGGGGGWPTGEYNPIKAPASPSAWDDEFLAGTLNVAWTIQDSGAGTRINSVTQRPGWLYESMLSGGGTCNTGVYKSFLPAGALKTIVARCFGQVNDAANNQILLSVADASGNLIYGVGKQNSATQNFYVIDSGGSRSYGITNIGGNLGETWLMLQYEGGDTIISAWVSGDGHVWTRLEGAARSGTIGRLKLGVLAAASSRPHAYWDFVRVLPGPTYEVGGVG